MAPLGYRKVDGVFMPADEMPSPPSARRCRGASPGVVARVAAEGPAATAAPAPVEEKRAVPKGKVKDLTSWGERWRRRRQVWFYPYRLERSAKRYVARAFLLAVVWYGLPVMFPGLQRAADATAMAFETVAGAANTFVDAGMGITASASQWIAVPQQSARAISNILWRGVDLAGLKADTQTGALITDDVHSFAKYIMSDGKLLVAALDGHRGQFAEALWAISDSRPAMTLVWEEKSIMGSFSAFYVNVRRRPSGFWAISWAAVNATFSPQWSNPWWEILHSPLEREAHQVLGKVKAALVRIHADQTLLDNLTIPEDAEEGSPMLLFTSAARRWRAYVRFARRAVRLLNSIVDPVIQLLTPWEWDWWWPLPPLGAPA